MTFSSAANAQDGDFASRRLDDEYIPFSIHPAGGMGETNPGVGAWSTNLRLLRPCGVASGSTIVPGFIRHLSANGAQIETHAALSVGDEIHYFWDGLPPLRARVAWICEGLVGLRNLPQDRNAASLRVPRALRVACRLPARIDRGRESFKGFVGNISQRGLLFYGGPGMETGSRLDLTVCGHVFPDAEVRWSRAGCLGVSLCQQIGYETISALMDMVAAEQGEPVAGHFAPPDNRQWIGRA